MKHILLVDDAIANLKSTEAALKKKYRLTIAKTGEQTMRLLMEDKPDLILLDTNLPDMSGYDLLELLKKGDKFANIPVIFLSSETSYESETRGLKMGAMDFIKKPYIADVLLSRIAKVLEMEDTRKTLELMANKDSLTTLWNRRYMEEYIEKGERKLEKGVFMLLNMDNFKQINHSYGHLMGDDVLVAFASTLRESAGTENTVCRIGGDEFVVFINGDQPEEKVREISRRLIASIEYEINRLLDFEEEIRISVSIGIAFKPEDGHTFKTLYSNADKALYYVKQNGKRGYHFYHETHNTLTSIQEENSLIDLINLRRMIQETEDPVGAYQVEYSGFKRIYRFVSRCMERSGQDVQIVLFGISAEAGLEAAENAAEGQGTKMEQSMKELGEAITISLRKGDVAAQYSASQYVAILMGASSENGQKAVERIINKWQKKKKYPEYAIHFDIQSVKGIDENHKQ